MYMYPYKRKAEGDLTQIEEKEAEVEVTWLQAKKCQYPPEAGKVKEQIFP